MTLMIRHYKGKLMYKTSNVDLREKKNKKRNKKKIGFTFVNETNFKKKISRLSSSFFNKYLH
jgi:hypothetical protein